MTVHKADVHTQTPGDLIIALLTEPYSENLDRLPILSASSGGPRKRESEATSRPRGRLGGARQTSVHGRRRQWTTRPYLPRRRGWRPPAPWARPAPTGDSPPRSAISSGTRLAGRTAAPSRAAGSWPPTGAGTSCSARGLPRFGGASSSTSSSRAYSSRR